MNSKSQGRLADVREMAAAGERQMATTGARQVVAGRTPPECQIRTGVDVQAISAFREFDPGVAAGIKDRAFADAERAYCERTGDPPQHYAARWAAKEAFVKLLADDRTAPFDEIAVVRDGERPRLELGEAARAELDQSFEGEPHSLDVSLSHDRDADVAMAQVVALSGGGTE